MTRLLAVASGVFAVLTVGCGSPTVKTVTVKGRLVNKDGTPFKVQRPANQPLPPGDPGLRVKFARVGDPAPGEDAFYYASVNAEQATFEVPGKANKGIPPGTYQVTVSVGAAGELGGKGGKLPSGGPPGAGAPSMDGVEVARKDFSVPDEGLPDLAIEIELKK